MNPSLESRIQAFVADQTGCNPKKVHLHSRIAEDLGVDGDDAVELFEAFAERYGVDLMLLHDRWRQHFWPEGGGVPSAALVALFVCMAAGIVIHDLSRGNIPAWIPVGPLLAVWWQVARRLTVIEEPPTIPITVQDLVDAAAARQWVKQYKGSGTGMLFRTLS